MLEEYLNDQNVVTKLLLDSIECEKTVQAYLFVCNDMNYLEKFAKAFSKKKRQEIREGKLYPVTKPDTDNYVKTVLDAANEIAFKDDSAVIGILARKYYSDIPRIEVALFEVEDLSTVCNNEFIK